jgi:hypothetical protein
MTSAMARFRRPNQHGEVAQGDSLPKSRSRVPRACGNEIPTLGVRQHCHPDTEQIGHQAVGRLEPRRGTTCPVSISAYARRKDLHDVVVGGFRGADCLGAWD